MKYTNVPSFSTAIKNGMTLLEEYADPVNTITRVYVLKRESWEAKQ